MEFELFAHNFESLCRIQTMKVGLRGLILPELSLGLGWGLEEMLAQESNFLSSLVQGIYSTLDWFEDMIRTGNFQCFPFAIFSKSKGGSLVRLSRLSCCTVAKFTRPCKRPRTSPFASSSRQWSDLTKFFRLGLDPVDPLKIVETKIWRTRFAQGWPMALHKSFTTRWSRNSRVHSEFVGLGGSLELKYVEVCIWSITGARDRNWCRRWC